MQVILDLDKTKTPAPNSRLIESEVDFLRYFLVEDCTYWVRGKFLCDWARELLLARGQADLIQHADSLEIKSEC